MIVQAGKNTAFAAGALGPMQQSRQHSTVIAHMVEAAEAWLRQREHYAPVTQLSGSEHAALKALMFAAVADEVAFQPDLDRAIAYLQALGALALAEEEKAAKAA